ncbi:MAG TPA: signal peptidase I [Lentisphaeria bacterium]|nr:signal peptidase I [Lentisphaeria bacterium]
MFSSMSLLAKVAMVIYDILLFLVWPGSYLLNGPLGSQQRKNRHFLKQFIKQIRHRREWDRDILSADEDAKLFKVQQRAEQLYAAGPEVHQPSEPQDHEDLPQQRGRKGRKGAQQSQDAGLGATECERFMWSTRSPVREATMPMKFVGYAREGLDALVVVIGVIMGARAMYLQPFKIPTGSMQPTLYGIEFFQAPPDEPQEPNIVARVMDYWNYARRYAYVALDNDLPVKAYNLQGGGQTYALCLELKDTSIPFYPKCRVAFGSAGRVETLPGSKSHVFEYLHKYRALGDTRLVDGKWTQINGHFDLGDHLFVERVSLQFRDPQRGDILVFNTIGMIKPDGTPLRGPFFIKRLVALPGETVKIIDDRLWVKEPGASEFRGIDENDHSAFGDIYSFANGYAGHTETNYPRAVLKAGGQLILGDDEYFMMGDNTNNSEDGRIWGAVKRKNIVGRALFVYWPFGARWGLVNRDKSAE